MIVPSANYQNPGHEGAVADCERLNGIHESRGSLAQSFHLPLIGLGVCQSDRANFGSPGCAGLLNVGGLALGFLHSGLGPVGLDVHSDFRLGKIDLHVGGAASLFRFDALVLRLPLHLECFHFLMRYLTLGENSNELLGVNHILDINSPGLDFVLGEFALNVVEGLLLDHLASLNESNRFHATNFVATAA